MNDFMEALRYYEPLQQVDGCVDVPYLFEIASCYRALGRETEAKNCYKSIVEIDGGNYEARLRLADGHDVEDMTQCSPQDLSQTYVPNHPRTWKHMGIKHARQGKSAMSLAPRAAHPSSRRLADEELQVHEREIYGLFTHQQSIGKAISKGDGVHSMEWLAATESLLQDFRENKIFYPVDKHHKFLGYSREARLIAARTKSELEMLIERSGSIIGMNRVPHIGALLVNGCRNTSRRSDQCSDHLLWDQIPGLAGHVPRIRNSDCIQWRFEISV